MRHLYSGRKLKRTNSHRKALLMNLATSLLQHKRVQTTEAKAKELRPFVEQLITRAKNAYLRERSGQLPAGQTVDVHARRVVGRIIHNKGVLQELFDGIAPVVESRPGGYTRITKLGQRRGDGSRTAVIELVDYYAEQDGGTSLSRTKKRRVTRSQQAPKAETSNVQDTLEQSVAAAVTSIEANIAEEAPAQEEVEAEAPATEEAAAQDTDTNAEPSNDGEGDNETQK
jgi:large subunit ribosomal protein L17